MNDDDKLSLALMRDVVGAVGISFLSAAADAPWMTAGFALVFADLGRTIVRTLKESRRGRRLTAADLQEIKRYVTRVQRQLNGVTAVATAGTVPYNKCVEIQQMLLRIGNNLDKVKPDKLHVADYEQYISDIEANSQTLEAIAKKLH